MFDLVSQKIGRENVVNFIKGKELGKEINYYYFMYKNEEFVEIWLNGNNWFCSIDNFNIDYGNKDLNKTLEKMKEELCS